ncbi:glycosyltransferase family protein [Rathayibacter agropyri]
MPVVPILRHAGSAMLKRCRFLLWRATGSLRTGSLLGDAPVVVSLTSFGLRIGSVDLVIEAIGAGTVRPRRLILWLSEADLLRPLPPRLLRLRRRGLEIIGCPDLKSHKKYYPYAVERAEIALPLVTADDDVYYPRDWLEGLVRSHKEHPTDVLGYRSKEIRFDDAGRILSYQEWPLRRSAQPSFRVFHTGMAGVLYPIAVLEEARRHGTSFMDVCPGGDDLWLHRSTLRAGAVPRQVGERALELPGIPGAQRVSLMSANLDEGGNDRQFHATYSETDVDAIRSDVRA